MSPRLRASLKALGDGPASRVVGKIQGLSMQVGAALGSERHLLALPGLPLRL